MLNLVNSTILYGKWQFSNNLVTSIKGSCVRMLNCRLLCVFLIILKYRKIPKISPGAKYIFQRPFLRGLYSEGLLYGGKSAFQNRLGSLIVGRKCYRSALLYFVFGANF